MSNIIAFDLDSENIIWSLEGLQIVNMMLILKMMVLIFQFSIII